MYILLHICAYYPSTPLVLSSSFTKYTITFTEHKNTTSKWTCNQVFLGYKQCNNSMEDVATLVNIYIIHNTNIPVLYTLHYYLIPCFLDFENEEEFYKWIIKLTIIYNILNWYSILNIKPFKKNLNRNIITKWMYL